MNCMQPTQKICRNNNKVSENCSGDEHCRDFDHHFRNQICHRALVEFQTILSKRQNTKGYNTEGTEGISKLAKNCGVFGALMSIVYCWLCIIVTFRRSSQDTGLMKLKMSHPQTGVQMLRPLSILFKFFTFVYIPQPNALRL